MPRLRILLVDDHPAFLRAMAMFLGGNELAEVVGEAKCGREALEKVRRLAPDLVLLDLAMPGMDGLEVMRRIKSTANAPRVVVLTLNDAPIYRRRAQAHGADGFLSKTNFDTELQPVILELFAARLRKAE